MTPGNIHRWTTWVAIQVIVLLAGGGIGAGLCYWKQKASMPAATGVVNPVRLTPTASENSDILSLASGEFTDPDLVTDRLTPVLAALDVEGAVQLLDQIMADRDPNREAQSIFTEVFQRLTELDPGAAWRWAESNRWPRGLLPLAKFVLRSYAKVDPSEVERIAERLPNGQFQTAAWSALARAVWPMDATRAISYVRKCRDPNALELFAVEIASSPSGDVDALWSVIKASPNHEALLGQIVAAVANRDPESGMKLLREQRRVLSPGEAENLERKIIVDSCERDPVAALRALEQLPTGEGRLFAGGQIFRRWVQVDSKSAWEAAMGLPDGPEKSAALVAMASEEIFRDPGRLESLLALMPSQSSQNVLTLQAIGAMNSRDESATFQMALEISKPELREEAMDGLFAPVRPRGRVCSWITWLGVRTVLRRSNGPGMP